MMIENHLRHVKPSEFNRSVIWASRIGLFLLLLVGIVAIVPIVAQQVQRGTIDSTSRQWKQSDSNGNLEKSMRLEFNNEHLVRIISPLGSYISSGVPQLLKHPTNFSVHVNIS